MDVNDTVTSPDVSEIDAASLAERDPSPATLEGAAGSFHVVVSRGRWDELLKHARSTTEVEVGGVMLGKTYRDPAGRAYLLIEGSIPALAAESKAANVTFTAEAWTRIHEVIDRDHPGAQIVGWYHTHPNFGIFLSEMDVFIQRHFFDLPHQIAIVVDPVADTYGCFTWQRGTPTEQPLVIEGEPTKPVPERRVAPLPPQPETIESKPKPSPETKQRPTLPSFLQLDAEQWAAIAGLALLLLVTAAAIAMLLRSTPPTTSGATTTRST